VNKSLKLVNDDAEELKPMANLLIGYLMAFGADACFQIHQYLASIEPLYLPGLPNHFSIFSIAI
jgi:hypothetical protein